MNQDVNPLENFQADLNKPFKEQVMDLLNVYVKDPLGQEAIKHYYSLDKKLKEDQILDYALKTGDRIPEFSLFNADGKLVDIYQFHRSEWLVIAFYRGQFCPFCNLELKNLQKNLQKIEGAPARLVAISPQTVVNTNETRLKNGLQFEMLSDRGSLVGKKFRLVYTVPNYLVDFHKKIGVDDQYFNKEGEMELPMPATYIVDKEGIIRYHFIETNAGIRFAPEKIASIIQRLKESRV